MKACPRCPNRWSAEIARAAGWVELADRIESGGCPDYYEAGDFNSKTNRIENQRWVCGREEIADHLTALGGEMKLAAETVQAERNEGKVSLEAIVRLVAAMLDKQTQSLHLLGQLAEKVERLERREGAIEVKTRLPDNGHLSSDPHPSGGSLDRLPADADG